MKEQTRREKRCCSCCKSKNVIRSGSNVRRIRSVPIGRKPVNIELKVRRSACRACNTIRQESIYFVRGKHGYTNKMAWLAIDLSRIGTIIFFTCHGIRSRI